MTLLGRNGMGKTTTARSIMGLTPSTRGSIRFQGVEIGAMPAYRIAQCGIGLVPEGRQIFPNLSVRENLVASAGNRAGVPDPWTLRETTHALDKASLLKRDHRYPPCPNASDPLSTKRYFVSPA